MLSKLKKIVNRDTSKTVSPVKEKLDELNLRLQAGEDLDVIIEETNDLCVQYSNQDSPYRFLAYCHQKNSDFEATEVALLKAIKINRHNPTNWDKLGLIRLRKHNLEKADQAFEKATQLDSKNAYYHHHRGLGLAELGWNIRAARAQQHAVKLKPDFADAYNAMGIVYTEEKQYKQAISAFKKAVQHAPKMIHAWRNLTIANLKANLKEDSLTVLKQATSHNPDNTELKQFHASVLRKLHKPQESIEILESLISDSEITSKLDPMLLFELAESYLHTEENLQAEKYCRQGLSSIPNSVHGLSLLGTIYLNLQWIDQALQTYEQALELSPDDDFLLSKIGLCLNILGKHSEARELYEKSLKQYPENTHIISQLTSYQKLTDNDLWLIEHINKVRPKLEDSNDKVRVHFALGKIYDDLKEYDKAFKHYKRGNDLKFYRFNYDENSIKNSIDQIIDYFTSHKQKPTHLPSSESEQPIFIVGMPRSGTSLVEQIIASHPDVTGAGELSLLPQKLRKLCEAKSINYPNILDQLKREESQELIDYYLNASLKQVARLTTSNEDINDVKETTKVTKHISDKLPYNFFNIGLIFWLYPNSKIIHTKRNPIDTCLSCYFQNFSTANEHTFNLEALAEYYLQYKRLMGFWNEIFPNQIIEIEYEKLVSEQTIETKRLITELNLRWNDRCLNFQDTDRSVQTASAWQVRQKIYDSSKARWRKYEKHLRLIQNRLEIS